MENKSKQIAFLAFFKGMCDLNAGKGNDELEGIWKKSHELVKALENIYPIEQLQPMTSVSKPSSYNFNPTATISVKAPLCDSCGNTMNLVKAGISKKTGKSYKAFWSCPEKGHPTKQYFDGIDKARAQYEDGILDEASHIPVLEDSSF